MENVSEDTVFGAGKMEDFTWKQMLDFSTCTECGRCQSVCPAWTTGKPLSPKLVIMGLPTTCSPRRTGSCRVGRIVTGRDTGPHDHRSDVLWSCTTCGACVEQCPVDIEHVDRSSTCVATKYSWSRASRARRPCLRNMENQGDPVGTWRLQGATEWLAALDVECPSIDGPIPN